MISIHGHLQAMSSYRCWPRSGLVFIVVLSLSGCGAGESARSESAQGDLSSASIQRLERSSAKQKARVDQSIRKIKNHPLSKQFAVTVSYPYVITGNLPLAELEHWKSRVLRTQAAIKSMYFRQDPSEVVQIWLFRDAASYFYYNKSLWSASPSTRYGYYLPKQKRMMMNIASGGGTLTHELVHPYIEVNFPSSPLWFNEGLASLYEQSYYKGGKVYGVANWRLQSLKSVIAVNSMPSLEQMMHTNRQQFLGENQEIYYAQARYLMLYLQSRGLLEKYYHQFSNGVTLDKAGIKTLLKLTGYQSMEQLEGAWLSFIWSLNY